MKNKEQINKGKIQLLGEIELCTPLHIGSGEDDNSDIDVLKDKQGLPFIPATSFIGVLRHHLKSILTDDEAKKFWGFTNDNDSQQSTITCSDLALINDDTSRKNIVIRDGVKINNKTGLAEDKAKFDFEVVERGCKFGLKLQADYDKDEVLIQKIFNTIKSELEEGQVSLGFRTNSGLGRIKLINGEIYKYDLTNDKRHILNWLKGELAENGLVEDTRDKFDINNYNFQIDALFNLKTSLLVSSYPSKPELPDAVHITSNDEYILPGTSLKGAIRARAEKILNTIKDDLSISNELFGFVDLENKKVKKGKIKIEEKLVKNCVGEVQTRIKIDRFTGGTISGALFDEMPLFAKGEDTYNQAVNVKISIKDCNDCEAGLMLLILKDLWTGDLALGGGKNVGRGVLEGVKADITIKGNRYTIEKDLTKLDETKRTELQTYIKSLSDKEEKKNDE